MRRMRPVTAAPFGTTTPLLLVLIAPVTLAWNESPAAAVAVSMGLVSARENDNPRGNSKAALAGWSVDSWEVPGSTSKRRLDSPRNSWQAEKTVWLSNSLPSRLTTCHLVSFG